MQRRREQTAVNALSDHPRQYLLRSSHLDHSYLAVGLNIPLSEHKPEQEIVRPAEARHTDSLALQVLRSLDLRLNHDFLTRLMIRTGEHDEIGAGKIGLNHRRNCDFRDRDFLGEHGLDHFRTAADKDLFNIQSMP